MRRITHCLNPSLTTICKRAIELESLTAIVQLYLPEAHRAHCIVGSFNKGCLVLMVSDPVWASEIRYSLPGLRDHLRLNAGLHQLITIKINVTLEDKPSAAKTRHTPLPTLSDDSRQTILASSEQCEYPPLKQALDRLSRKK